MRQTTRTIFHLQDNALTLGTISRLRKFNFVYREYKFNGATVKTTQIEIEAGVPSILFDETDVTPNWRNRVQSGGYRIQYATNGTTFTDYISLGANAFTLAKDTTFTEQAFSAATSSGDASSTLTTKGYVDSLITGATIYRGLAAGISLLTEQQQYDINSFSSYP